MGPFGHSHLVHIIAFLAWRAVACWGWWRVGVAGGELRGGGGGRGAGGGDTELVLSSREFALLEFLLRHAGEVVTRTMILEHVWDVAFDPVSNVVDQYVAYLRRKIDRP